MPQAVYHQSTFKGMQAKYMLCCELNCKLDIQRYRIAKLSQLYAMLYRTVYIYNIYHTNIQYVSAHVQAFMNIIYIYICICIHMYIIYIIYM